MFKAPDYVRVYLILSALSDRSRVADKVNQEATLA